MKGFVENIFLIFDFSRHLGCCNDWKLPSFWGFASDPNWWVYCTTYGSCFVKSMNVLYGLCLSKVWHISDSPAYMVSFLYFSEKERGKKVPFTRLKKIWKKYSAHRIKNMKKVQYKVPCTVPKAAQAISCFFHIFYFFHI